MLYDKEFWVEIYVNLKSNRKRAYTTGLGVFGAIFSLVILTAAGNGLDEGVKNRFKNIQMNSFFIYPNKTTKSYKTTESNKEITLNYNDFLTVRNLFGGLCTVITSRTHPENEVKEIASNQAKTTCNLIAVDDLNINTNLVNINHGRYVSISDIKEHKKNILLGKIIAQEIFNDSTIIGGTVRIDNSFYKVIGIFESMKEGNSGDFDNNSCLIPQATYNLLYNTNKIGSIEIIPLEHQYNNVKSDIVSYIKSVKVINPDDSKGIFVRDNKLDAIKFISLFKSIRYFLWFISGIMLLLGLVNIGNVMNISVNERLKEIGIRKTIGASPRDILSMILVEAICITVISGTVGLLLGVSLVNIINFTMTKYHLVNEFFMHPYIEIPILIYALILLVVTGIFIGTKPARKASIIKPISVLHNE